jgi:hypothetical protein
MTITSGLGNLAISSYQTVGYQDVSFHVALPKGGVAINLQ